MPTLSAADQSSQEIHRPYDWRKKGQHETVLEIPMTKYLSKLRGRPVYKRHMAETKAQTRPKILAVSIQTSMLLNKNDIESLGLVQVHYFNDCAELYAILGAS